MIFWCCPTERLAATRVFAEGARDPLDDFMGSGLEWLLRDVYDGDAVLLERGPQRLEFEEDGFLAAVGSRSSQSHLGRALLTMAHELLVSDAQSNDSTACHAVQLLWPFDVGQKR